jgi:hypothetical protein
MHIATDAAHKLSHHYSQLLHTCADRVVHGVSSASDASSGNDSAPDGDRRGRVIERGAGYL